MVIKLYISGISGNKEVKKKQQRVQMILDSKQIIYEAIDIAEPGKEKDKEFMQQNGKVRESLGKHPLPPQIFNDNDFCGDYEDFDMANEVDELEEFLHIATNSKELENGSKPSEDLKSLNSDLVDCDNVSKTSSYDPYTYHTLKFKLESVNGLQEQIIKADNQTGESEKADENPKSEVNGESEAVSTSQPSIENIAESKSETSTEEVPVPIKEEGVSTEEKIDEEEKKENVTENEESGVEAEEDTKRVEEEEESEKPKEKSGAEQGNEEESPHAEGDDVEENVGNESKEKDENEGEEENVGNESKEKDENEGEEENVGNESKEKDENEGEEEEKKKEEKEEEGDDD